MYGCLIAYILSAVVVFIAHSGALCLVRLAAVGATRRLVFETLFRIKLLLAGGKSEFFAAVSASQYLISHNYALLLLFKFQKRPAKALGYGYSHKQQAVSKTCILIIA